MGTRRRRKHTLTATTGAIAWVIRESDDFDVLHINLMFSSAPAAIENVQVWYKSDAGISFDCIVRSIDPNGGTNISFEGVNGVENGDWVEVIYANTDGIEIRGLAVVEM